MAYVKFPAYHVPVLDLHQCWINLGFMVFCQRNRYATNLSPNCTYWPVLGPYNNWNIIKITPKYISFEEFDEIHKAVLDGISENMASLVQSVMYGAINKDDTTTNEFYVIQFISEAYTIQNNTTIYGQVISAGELVFKA